MKGIITLILSVLTLIVCGQKPQLVKRVMDTSKTLEYIREHFNTKIKKGICFDFVKKAMTKQNKKWYKEQWLKREKYKVASIGFFMNKKKKKEEFQKNDIDKIQLGDVIVFRNAVFSNGIEAEAHIGIVLELMNDSTVGYVEQNSVSSDTKTKKVRMDGAKVEVAKDSRVDVAIVGLHKLKRGVIVFYRF